MRLTKEEKKIKKEIIKAYQRNSHGSYDQSGLKDLKKFTKWNEVGLNFFKMLQKCEFKSADAAYTMMYTSEESSNILFEMVKLELIKMNSHEVENAIELISSNQDADAFKMLDIIKQKITCSINAYSFLEKAARYKYTSSQINWLLSREIYSLPNNQVDFEYLKTNYERGFPIPILDIGKKSRKYEEYVVSEFEPEEVPQILHLRINLNVLKFLRENSFEAFEIIYYDHKNLKFDRYDLEFIFTHKVDSKEDFIKQYL